MDTVETTDGRPPKKKSKRRSAFAKRLRARRKETGLKPMRVALKAGIHPMTLWRLENSEKKSPNLTLGSTIALAAVLEVGLDWLLLGRGPMCPEWSQRPAKKG